MPVLRWESWGIFGDIHIANYSDLNYNNDE
jgi:hypothetical protein